MGVSKVNRGYGGGYEITFWNSKVSTYVGFKRFGDSDKRTIRQYKGLQGEILEGLFRL